jgi:alkaline phosphatase
MAAEGAKIWKKFGALDYKECVGQDLKPAKGNPVMSFTKMAKTKSNETVWFSYITYKDKKHRDAVNKKVMAHFDKKYADAKDMKMPFDMKRMAYGGFSVVVS